MAYNDERAFDIGDSQAAQANFDGVAKRLEDLIQQRRGDIRRAMPHYKATNVSDEYVAKENIWTRFGEEVHVIVATLRSVLAHSDESAAGALRSASDSVAHIEG